MYISKLQIKNYKSFKSSNELDLVPGFNIILGRNNSGKTALTEALSLRFSDNKPHRSLKTIPNKGMPNISTSTVSVDFQLDAGEAKQLLINAQEGFYVPANLNSAEYDKSVFLNTLQRPNLLRCVYHSRAFQSAYFEVLGDGTNYSNTINFNVDVSKHQFISDSTKFYDKNASPTYGLKLANILRERIYAFKAERMNIGESSFGIGSVLSSDASNLAEVLHNLQNRNPSGFNRLIYHVHNIFPEVIYITIPSIAINRVGILIWSIDHATERTDLAIPLSESGTGIGQVLAMLYVVLIAEYPQSIIIDEPQSFLHPGAVRKLIETLKQHPQHQYIITTHSPEIVAATNPETLFMLRKEDFETTLETMDTSEAQNQRVILSEIGVRLSDVFGADNILWVEGPTEELCFPLIVKDVLKKSLMGTKIIGVIQTGDFESKHSRLVIQIYKRLSKGMGLIPPAIGFIFDREGRNEQEQYDITKESQESVIFLPRRMYENYLLNPQAIASVVSQLENFRATQISSEEVDEWIQSKHLEEKYYDRSISQSEQAGDIWKQNIHGAKLLDDFFKETSDNRYCYEKIEYGFALTEWIVKNTPDDLTEVAAVINSRLFPES